MGMLDTTFSVVQLLGSPVMGRLCDVRGARLTIITAQVSGIVPLSKHSSHDDHGCPFWEALVRGCSG